MTQKEKRAHPFTGEPEETTAGATEQLETHTKSEYVQDATRSSDAVPLILDRIRLHRHDATDTKGRPMGKAPLLSGWRRLPALTEGEVAAHLAKGMNVGARLRDDQLVIDADPRHYDGGVNSLDRLIADFSIPHGPTVETGGGGFHIYLRKPAGVRVRDTLDGYPGVEFKTVGRQVVVPPSVHPNGRGYEWDALFGSDMIMPDVPDALLDRLRRPPRPSAVPDGTLTSEMLSKLLEGLDARDFDSNDTWLPLAMACHHATAGDGIDVFLDWCATDPAYADRSAQVRARWDSFSTERDTAVSVRTLYKALHAAGRGDLAELAERSDPVDDFPPYDGPVEVRRPAFLKKGDRIEANYRNVLRAIEAGNLGVGFDVITQRASLRAEHLPWVTDVGRELDDDLIRIVREWVMHQFGFEPGREDLSDVLLAMATKNPFNPIVDYLDALEWDGTARDQTGNRRYLPVVTTTIDLESLRRDRDQLWAEASVIEATGEGLTLPPDLWSVAAQRQGDRLVGDPWLDLLRAYVVGKQRVSAKELFDAVLELPYSRQSQLEAKRLSGLMVQLGFQHRKSLRFGQQVLTGYVIGDDPTNA